MVEERNITKLSFIAKKEREEQIEESTCPECDNTLNIGTYHIESKGFFKVKRYRITSYHCYKCGCEWNVKKEYE